PTPCLHPLSLHDALPISESERERRLDAPVVVPAVAHEHALAVVDDVVDARVAARVGASRRTLPPSPSAVGRTTRTSLLSSSTRLDRKSTRLNSSHVEISY